MDNEIKVKTWVKSTPFGEIEINGSNTFRINADRFVISPLQSASTLYVVSIHEGVEDEKAIADINAGEYTQINGLVKNILLRLDTEETFYIKF